MSYGERYGVNRPERADRIARNVPPAGNPVPRTTTRPDQSQFTGDFRYVERVRTPPSNQRTNIYVRSQKFKRTYKQYYVIDLGNQTQYDVFRRSVLQAGPICTLNWSCSCPDENPLCKHILAVVQKYQIRRYPRRMPF
jgi:hypothetical protein